MMADQASAQPLPQRPNAEGIPRILKARDRWVPVRGHWVITGDKAKLNKTPLRRGGGAASPNDPAHWWSFEDAYAEVCTMLEREQPALLFYVIDPNDGLVYGDADHAVDEQGRINEDSWEDVRRFDYVEVSPSGRGLRWVAMGTAPRNAEASDNTRAIHVKGYISITGHVVAKRGLIKPQQQAIDYFYGLCRGAVDSTPLPEVEPPPDIDTDDMSLSPLARELLEQCVAPPHGERSSVVQSIANAMAGDLGLSPREVFSALVNHPGVREVALDRRHGREHAARQWLWRVAQDSEPARQNYVGAWRPTVTAFLGPTPVGTDLFEQAPPDPPAVLVDGLIPCDVFGWVGAGGLAKTTLMLWLMVHVVLGRSVAGRAVRNAGPALFITAEDDLAVVRYRLRAVCDALELSAEDRRVVATSLYVEDVTGQLLRFVEGDRSQNLVMTRHVDTLCNAYKKIKPVLVVADPAIFFGPGEHRVNDSEAALMAAGRKIGSELARNGKRAAFGWIHHVSQTVAREGIVDQYASRGGTAFADNSRAQLVFAKHSKDHPEYPTPPGVLQSAVLEGRVLRLHVAKFSYGAHEGQPLWVVRGQGERAFHFDIFDPPPASEARAVQEATVRREALQDALAVYDFLETELESGAQHSKSSLRDQAGRIPGRRSSRRVTAAVSFLLSTGAVRETPIAAPAGRRSYLQPVTRPECPSGT